MTHSDPTHPEQTPLPRRAILDDRLARDPEVQRVLTGIEAWVPVTAPEPTAELLAALDALRPEPVNDVPAPVQLDGPWRRAARRPGYRRTVLAGAMAVAVAIPATGVAAANDRLPQPAERVVSRMVNELTPFTINPTSDLPTPAHSVHPPVPRSTTVGPARPTPGTGGPSGAVPAAAPDSPSAGGSGETEQETPGAVAPPTAVETEPADRLPLAGSQPEASGAMAEPASSGTSGD